MNASRQAVLKRHLRADEVNGISQFRKSFFDALEHRRLDDARDLLEMLDYIASSNLQREYTYYRSVLLIEERKFDRAEVLLCELLEDDNLSSEQRARTLFELAIPLNEQGQHIEAEKTLRDALIAYEAIFHDLGQAKSYNNIGITIRDQIRLGISKQERVSEILECHNRALDILSKCNRDEDDIFWQILRNKHGLGVAHGLMEQFHEAQICFEEHIAMCRKMNAPNRVGIGLSDLAALVYQPLGNLDRTEDALSEAITLFEQHSDHLHLAEALTRRGNLWHQRNNTDKALQDYLKALAWAESIRTRLTAPTSQAGYRSSVEFIYSAPLSLYLHRRDAEKAFNAAERIRSRVLADLLTNQSTQPHSQIPNQLLKQRKTLHLKLDEAYNESKPDDDIDELEASLADLERKIELQDPAYHQLNTLTPITAEQVRHRLERDAVILTYAWDSDEHLWIIVLTSTTKELKHIPKVTKTWMQSYLLQYLNENGRHIGRLVPNANSIPKLRSPNNFLADLYRVLVEPVWEWVEPAQNVYIIPSGPLHYLPIGALPMLSSPPASTDSDRRVIYVPSATILFETCHKHSPSPHQNTLAVVPPDEDLSFTESFVNALAHRENIVSLTGANSNRQALIEHANHCKVLCFLGHAIFNSKHPMASYIQLADGSFHASEILRDLRVQTGLIVLAACESGRSDVLQGDEILGLTRALLYAGTPSVLVTLWPVHEVPTCLLLGKFFEQLSLIEKNEGRFDPALALARAQMWLRTLSCSRAKTIMSKWEGMDESKIDLNLTNLWHWTNPQAPPEPDRPVFEHPHFWAAYIVIGDQQRSHG